MNLRSGLVESNNYLRIPIALRKWYIVSSKVRSSGVAALSGTPDTCSMSS